VPIWEIFEIAEFSWTNWKGMPLLILLTTDCGAQAIKEYLDQYIKKNSKNPNYYFIKVRLSHIFEMNAALSKNEIICMTGDRYGQTAS